VVGPLVAGLLLGTFGMDLRHVFLAAFVPALAAVVVIVAAVREEPRQAGSGPSPGGAPSSWRELTRDYWLLLAAILVFTLGNSTDAFLLLRLAQAGVPTAWIATLWAAHHVVRVVATYLGGRLSDRVGPRPAVLAGWATYAAVYAAFALVDSRAGLVAVFLAYGVYYGLAEPAERAWVANVVPARLRGTAFGFYHGAIGIAALPASLLFGLLWQAIGPLAFAIGGSLSLVAAALLLAPSMRGRTASAEVAAGE
jgi:MFS family permease